VNEPGLELSRANAIHKDARDTVHEIAFINNNRRDLKEIIVK